MDLLVLVLVSLSFCFVFGILISFFKNQYERKLPPGPVCLPIIGSPVLFGKSMFDIETILNGLRIKYGSIVTLYLGSRPIIYISDRTLAFQALIQKGATFADRPPPLPHERLLSSNQHNISSSAYGPLWRQFRRNLATEVLHPSRVKDFAPAREWVLRELSRNLRSQCTGPVTVIGSFHNAMFCLLVVMCFGGEPQNATIREIEDIQRSLLISFHKYAVFAFLTPVTKLLFWKRWNVLISIREKQKQIFIPLIRARKHNGIGSYVDSLLRLRLEGDNELTEEEIVSLCSEFLAAGTDTTTTALQWVMANLVRLQDVQAKLVREIESVVGSDLELEIKENDLQKMPYLKAVILEALRLHPPGHFVLPHAVTEEVYIGGYLIPKNASINFMVAEMSRDGEAWEEPMEFKPERFLAGGSAEGVDITGSREIKMMPFGAGRRICPGLGLAMLHLEYFVANLVREFEWKSVEGEEIDLSEKLEFAVVMQNPLRARIIPRASK